MAGIQRSQSGGAVNSSQNQDNTDDIGSEQKGIGKEAQSSVNQSQNQTQGTTANQSQNSINNTQGEVQGNNQNASASLAQQQAVDQGNAQFDAISTAAKLEQQRQAEFSAVLGSIATS